MKENKKRKQFTEKADGHRVLLYINNDGKIYFDLGDNTNGGRISAARPAGFDNVYHVSSAVRRTNNTGEVFVDGKSSFIRGNYLNFF
jgi:hypothetical protein